MSDDELASAYGSTEHRPHRGGTPAPDHASAHDHVPAHSHGHDHAPAGGADDEALAELLDLDAEVLPTYWADVMTAVELAADTGCRRVLDLGAGSGVGTIALAQRFPDAEVIAVDVAEVMLGRIRAKAASLGLGSRVRTVHADLDVVQPDLEPLDVTWASLSLHHLADPDRVLADVLAATRPGGLIAVAEMVEPLRFLPDDLGFGRPGLETRCLDARRAQHAHSRPELGSDWSARLAAAGFAVLSERDFVIDVRSPLPPKAVRYAQRWLQRTSSGVADDLAEDDVDVIAKLLDEDGPHYLGSRSDLHIRGIRTVTLARRL